MRNIVRKGASGLCADPLPALRAALELALLTALVFLAPAANAQLLQGTMQGAVTDSTQAAIVGAEVTIVNDDTNETRTTTTNQFGAFTFPTLNTGTYTVTVSSEGFQRLAQTGVSVTINNITRVDVELEVGQVTETVTVQASAATLQTDSAAVRAEITEKALKDLPVPLGRNYQMLYVTLPGFSPPENAHSIPTNPSRAVRFSVNGTSRSNNNTRIDGVSSTNIWVPHMTGYVPALEAIETVNVVTNSFDAEQGLAGGAAINVQLKSGTNALHGSVFEYNTVQSIKAYPWNSDRTQPKPKFIYNQFGATVGGPIKKNKAFFFFSYEGTRENEFGQKFLEVPSANMRTGDLSTSGTVANPGGVFDPMTGEIDGTNRIQFPNNTIPQSRIDPAVQKIIGTGDWPLPNQPGVGQFELGRNFLGGGSTAFERDTFDTKVNWNASDQLTAFLRFSLLDYDVTNGQLFGPLGGERVHRTNSNPGNGFGKTASVTGSATFVVTPNFIIDGSAGYQLTDTNVEQDRLDENVGLDEFGIPGTNGTRRFEGGMPRLQIDGFDQLGITNNFQPYFRSDPQWQYVANANWTKGNHNVRFGMDLYLQNLNHNQPEFTGSTGPASGGFRFRQGTTELRNGPSGNDFNSFASFLLGLPREAGKIQQFPDDGFNTRSRFYSAYFRDRWQVTPKLTLSLGVRWENIPFPTREDRGLERFDFDNNKILACGVGSIKKNCGIDEDEHRFVPRVGVAYRVNDDFVVRAGYGITNDPFNWARPLRTNFPIMLVLTLPAPNSRSFATTLRDGFPAFPETPVLGDGILDIASDAAVNTMDNANLTRGYIQSWNFTLERRWGNWITTAAYVATRSVNQLARLEQNFAPIDGGNSGRVLNQKFGRTATTGLFGSLGTSKYDSLQVRVERRFAGDYQVGVSYTWAKALGFTDEDSGDGPRVNIPEFFGLNYGRLNQDIRHNLQVTAIAELPFGPGKRWARQGFVSHLVGGWQLNSLFSAYTGRPFTITASGSSLNAPGSSQFADCIGEPRRLANRGGGRLWFDPSTFAPVTDARFGTCGTNNLSAPGLINADIGVFRRFTISERVKIEFRAEMFNIGNTPHFREPRSNVSSGNFQITDRIRNTGREGIDERTMRFGLRLSW